MDALFRLPPAEFTAARNALAKRSGKDAAAIKSLAKPPLAAWAVNQLYWQDRGRYDALVDAANDMRRTHKSVIEGKPGDLRTAGREHEVALDAALRATVALVAASGTTVTDAMRHAILNTLRALPAAEPPGRLTRALTPGGFEMLAGIAPAAAPKRTSGRPARDIAETASATKGREAQADRAAAERAVRDADQRARHTEFEAARAARDAAKATRRAEDAGRALEDAKQEFEEATRNADRAAKAQEVAERRSRDAQSALAAAKAKVLP